MLQILFSYLCASHVASVCRYRWGLLRNSSVDGRRIHAESGTSRLSLAKDALMALIQRLRPDDRFGLATFNNEGHVVQPLSLAAELQPDEPLGRTLVTRKILSNRSLGSFRFFEPQNLGTCARH